MRTIKRRKLLKRPFPQEWPPMLEHYLPFYRHIPSELRPGFHDKLKVFVWEKNFFGAAGFEINDEVKVIIGGSAVRLILYLDLSYYDRLTEIVVYPNHYKHKDETGIMLGEAHRFGTVVLSWPAVLYGLRHPCDGHDTALHEFAHILDRTGGNFDGTPKLRASEHYRVWAEVMSYHYLRLKDSFHKELSVLRDYGSKNEAEFFAVATEAFFERPVQMQGLTPKLYQELKRFYGLDPVSDPTCGLVATSID